MSSDTRRSSPWRSNFEHKARPGLVARIGVGRAHQNADALPSSLCGHWPCQRPDAVGRITRILRSLLVLGLEGCGAPPGVREREARDRADRLAQAFYRYVDVHYGARLAAEKNVELRGPDPTNLQEIAWTAKGDRFAVGSASGLLTVFSREGLPFVRTIPV